MGNAIAIRKVAKVAGVAVLAKAVYTVGKCVGIVKTVRKVDSDPELINDCHEYVAAIDAAVNSITKGRKLDIKIIDPPRAEETTVEETTDQPED